MGGARLLLVSTAQTTHQQRSGPVWLRIAAGFALCLLAGPLRGQAQGNIELPDAPSPQPLQLAAVPDGPVPFAGPVQAGQQTEPQMEPQTAPGFPPVTQPVNPQPSHSSRQNPGVPSQQTPCVADMSTAGPASMSCARPFNPYRRFVDASGPHPLTARQKGMLAVRNVTDPFNLLTIVGESGLAVASDPHSAYGPGMPGFGRSVGVAYTETLTSSFFGTFLIPVLVHQDPHYHRMPNAPVVQRVRHAAVAVVWARSDADTGMINYANLGNAAISDALGNLYVPGRQKGFGPGVSRFFTAIASDPIDNLISEFLPDVARHVNVQIVLVQRVVNEVERQNGGS